MSPGRRMVLFSMLALVLVGTIRSCTGQFVPSTTSTCLIVALALITLEGLMRLSHEDEQWKRMTAITFVVGASVSFLALLWPAIGTLIVPWLLVLGLIVGLILHSSNRHWE